MRRKASEVAAARTSGLANLVFSRQTVFFECEHPFIDKLMVTTERAVPSARLLGLGFKLYSRNMPRMLNKDLTRIMQSLSRVQQNQASERRALLAGCMSICSYPQSVLTLFLYFFAPRQVKTLQKRTKKSQMTLKHYFMKCAV